MNTKISRYSFILLVGFIIQYWFLYYSPVSLPKNIPGTPINIPGLLVSTWGLLIIILFQRSILKTNDQTSILKLTYKSAIVFLISECIFQAIRFPLIVADTFRERLFYSIRGVIVIPVFFSIIAFFVAFQLKTKRTRALLSMILAILVIFALARYYFPSLFLTDN